MEYAPGDAGLSAPVLEALRRLGIPRLYRHQGEALAAIRAGPAPPGGHPHGQRQDADL